MAYSQFEPEAKNITIWRWFWLYRRQWNHQRKHEQNWEHWPVFYENTVCPIGLQVLERISFLQPCTEFELYFSLTRYEMCITTSWLFCCVLKHWHFTNSICSNSRFVALHNFKPIGTDNQCHSWELNHICYW